jgi:hypothetical protein
MTLLLVIVSVSNFDIWLSVQGIETYTPRALIYDLKGSFGSLKKYNKLFEQEAEANNDSW